MNQPRPFAAAAARAAKIASELERHIMRNYARATPQEITMAFMTVVKKMDLAEAKRTNQDPATFNNMQQLAIMLAGGLQSLNFDLLRNLQADEESQDVIGSGDGGLVLSGGLDTDPGKPN